MTLRPYLASALAHIRARATSLSDRCWTILRRLIVPALVVFTAVVALFAYSIHKERAALDRSFGLAAEFKTKEAAAVLEKYLQSPWGRARVRLALIDPEVYLAYGTVLENRGKIDEALEQYGEVISACAPDDDRTPSMLDPIESWVKDQIGGCDQARTMTYLSEAFARIGDMHGSSYRNHSGEYAVKAYTSALEVVTNDPGTKKALSWFLAQKEKAKDEALKKGSGKEDDSSRFPHLFDPKAYGKASGRHGGY